MNEVNDKILKSKIYFPIKTYSFNQINSAGI